MRISTARWLKCFLVLGLGCRGPKRDAVDDLTDATLLTIGPAPSQPPPKTSAPSPAVPPAQVAAAVNPNGLSIYQGPTGFLEGVVYVEGDESPDQPLDFSKCAAGKSVHGPLFRSEGSLPRRPLLDAVVGVTGYANAYIPAPAEAVVVEIKDCALNQRTFVLTLGQGLDVLNREPAVASNFFALDLALAPAQALMVAAPRGEPTHIYPQNVGHDILIDKMGRSYLSADIFVTRQPLNTVTRAGGKYRIDRIPVGSLRASAMHPALRPSATAPTSIEKTRQVADEAIVIRANEGTTQHFVLSYRRGTNATLDATVVRPLR